MRGERGTVTNAQRTYNGFSVSDKELLRDNPSACCLQSMSASWYIFYYDLRVVTCYPYPQKDLAS